VLDINLLNGFARRFAESLFKEMPELEQYAMVDLENDERLKREALELTPEAQVFADREGWIGAIHLVIPPPEGSRIKELYIYTEGAPRGVVDEDTEYMEFIEEVTVDVGFIHHHYNVADESCSEEDAFGDAIEFIQRILSDREVFILGVSDGEICGVSSLRMSKDEKIVTCSWKGTHDIGEFE
jgi:hypothetical protein